MDSGSIRGFLKPDSLMAEYSSVFQSMDSYDKLPLIKRAFALVTENMGENDRISVVTYAASNKTLIDGATVNDKDRIMDELSSLVAYGSTNGEGGIQAAYEVAERNFIEGGINRVILATDGDLNVGVTSESELKKLIEEKRESGVYLPRQALPRLWYRRRNPNFPAFCFHSLSDGSP